MSFSPLFLSNYFSVKLKAEMLCMSVKPKSRANSKPSHWHSHHRRFWNCEPILTIALVVFIATEWGRLLSARPILTKSQHVTSIMTLATMIMEEGVKVSATAFCCQILRVNIFGVEQILRVIFGVEHLTTIHCRQETTCQFVKSDIKTPNSDRNRKLRQTV